MLRDLTKTLHFCLVFSVFILHIWCRTTETCSVRIILLKTGCVERSIYSGLFYSVFCTHTVFGWFKWFSLRNIKKNCISKHCIDCLAFLIDMKFVVCGEGTSVRRADHSSRGILPNVVCPSVIVKPRQWGGPGPLGAVAPWGGGKTWIFTCSLH
jgi:hypothetical protein